MYQGEWMVSNVDDGQLSSKGLLNLGYGKNEDEYGVTTTTSTGKARAFVYRTTKHTQRVYHSSFFAPKTTKKEEDDEDEVQEP